MKHLNPEQIDYLFHFVKSKNVPFVDVQHEIVDQFASEIEEMMEDNPNLDFKKSVKEIYARYPITGFAMFMLEKEKGLKIYWRKKLWQKFKSYFQWPKVAVIALLIWALTHFILTYQYSFVVFMLSILLLLFALQIHLRRKWKNLFEIHKKENLLYINVFTKHWGSWRELGIYLFFVVQYTLDPISISNVYIALFFSVIFVFMFIWTYIIGESIPAFLKEELDTRQKHLNLSA